MNTENDNELINSLFFLGTEAPSRIAPFRKLNPKTNGGFWFDPNDFADPPLGQFNNGTQRTICCGPGLQEMGLSVLRRSLLRNQVFQFRAEIFNIFNHTNFYNPDGGFSDGPTAFGRITGAATHAKCNLRLKLYLLAQSPGSLGRPGYSNGRPEAA